MKKRNLVSVVLAICTLSASFTGASASNIGVHAHM